MFQKLSKKQNIIALAIIISTVFLASLPYLVGYLRQGDRYFLAGTHLNINDIPVYVSYIEQAKQGKVLMANLFTGESQRNLFFTPFWLAVGSFARAFNLDSVLAYHLFRIILGIIFLLFIFYYFLDIFLDNFEDKIIALVLICFASGLSWLLNSSAPLDLIVSEGNTFLTLAYSGHYILSQLSILLIFYIFLKSKRSKVDFTYLFILALFLGFVHPYDIFIIFSVLTAYLLISFVCKKMKLIDNVKRYLFCLVVLAVGFTPSLLYYYFVVRSEFALWGWFQQNITLSPSFQYYLIAYGILIFLGLIGIYYNRKKISAAQIFLYCWAGVLFLIVYLPVSFQIRFISTAQIALAIIAVWGVKLILDKLLKKKYWQINIWLWTICFFVISFSNTYFIIKAIHAYQQFPEDFYIDKSYYRAMIYLKQNNPADSAILSGYKNGNLIPAISVKKVYIGHQHQTPDYAQKRKTVNDWFFEDNDQDAQKKEFLEKNNIEFIFYAKEEKELGGYDLTKADFLTLAYQNDEVKIFELK